MSDPIDIMEAVGKFLVYGLHDPRTGELRYIGKSSNGLQRPRSHIYPNENRQKSHRAHWIKQLLEEGLRPEIVVLEEYETGDGLGDMERLAIAHYRSMGFRLVNQTDGGEGAPGVVMSAETRAKMSASRKGKRLPPRSKEHAEKIAAANRGRPLSTETKAKLSAIRKGRRHGPETIEKMRQARLANPIKAQTGRPISAEVKEKIRAALVGRVVPEAELAKLSIAQRARWARVRRP